MRQFFVFLTTTFTAVIFIGGACLTGCSSADPLSGCKVNSNLFDVVSYPADSVTTLAEMGLTVAQFSARAKAAPSHSGNTAYDSLSIIKSPYFDVSVNGSEVPVYGTLAFVGASAKGAIHSYSTVLVRELEFSLEVSITSDSIVLDDAIVLPEKMAIIPDLAEGIVNATLTKTGAYTFLFNGASQQYAYTIFVRNYVDEEAEITKYRSLYGPDCVKVFDPGIHYADYININRDNTVLYLRAGSLLVANHKYDLNSRADERTTTKEPGIETETFIGPVRRFPFINSNNHKNIKVLGHGTIDFTRLDWHERNAIVLSNCDCVEIKGITLINAGNWNITLHRVTNSQVREVVVFGYRTNSDGINICNSKVATVSDCFVRTGDDAFSAKTLGSEGICDNVVFQDCIAWTGKARSYGITGEVNRRISNVTFKDSAVIYRDATWDNSRIGSLVIIVEQGGADISNITFENIEIFSDAGRPINCNVLGHSITGCRIEDVTFRDIKYSGALKSSVSAANETNLISVTFDHLSANDTVVDERNVMGYFEKFQYANYTFK